MLYRFGNKNVSHLTTDKKDVSRVMLQIESYRNNHFKYLNINVIKAGINSLPFLCFKRPYVSCKKPSSLCATRN